MNKEELITYRSKKAIEYANNQNEGDYTQNIAAFIAGCDCVIEVLKTSEDINELIQSLQIENNATKQD